MHQQPPAAGASVKTVHLQLLAAALLLMCAVRAVGGLGARFLPPPPAAVSITCCPM